MRGDYALFFGLWLQNPLQITPIAVGPLRMPGARVAHVRRNLPPARIWALSTLARDVRESE